MCKKRIKSSNSTLRQKVCSATHSLLCLSIIPRPRRVPQPAHTTVIGGGGGRRRHVTVTQEDTQLRIPISRIFCMIRIGISESDNQKWFIPIQCIVEQSHRFFFWTKLFNNEDLVSSFYKALLVSDTYNYFMDTLSRSILSVLQNQQLLTSKCKTSNAVGNTKWNEFVVHPLVLWNVKK